VSRTPGTQQHVELERAERLAFSVTASPSAAPKARQAVAGYLSERLGRDGLLLLTELVNNAVIHGSSSPAARVSVDLLDSGERVRVEVRDDGAGFTWRRPPDDPNRTTGYGLVLVEAVAHRWGTDTASGRNCVWFEL
jgi:anti-sigma regulatory factor (Ser/Thr protein kinase)